MSPLNSLNCCWPARLKWNVEAWLIPESEVIQLWIDRFRLYRCPSCGQLWIWRSELVGHQEWNLTWRKVESAETFHEVIADQRAEDEKKQAKLKKQYEELGLEWPSGQRLR